MVWEKGGRGEVTEGDGGSSRGIGTRDLGGCRVERRWGREFTHWGHGVSGHSPPCRTGDDAADGDGAARRGWLGGRHGWLGEQGEAGWKSRGGRLREQGRQAGEQGEAGWRAAGRQAGEAGEAGWRAGEAGWRAGEAGWGAGGGRLRGGERLGGQRGRLRGRPRLGLEAGMVSIGSQQSTFTLHGASPASSSVALGPHHDSTGSGGVITEGPLHVPQSKQLEVLPSMPTLPLSTSERRKSVLKREDLPGPTSRMSEGEGKQDE